jgi:7-cyano-7-deazaguanine synthase
MGTDKPAVVLLSGGLDSATVLAIALDQGYRPVTLTFRYGQRHAAEIDVAARIARAAGITRHVVADIDLRAFGGSALTADIDVPKHRSDAEIGDGIPITYVPARNTVFLSFALALAETTQAFDVFIGVNALDYSGYPDCRPEYVKAFENVMNLATKAGVEGANPFTLHTPLIDLSKADIVKRGTALGVNYADTLSCYDPTPDGAHCGSCDACHLRQKGFKEAGITDPTPYAGS